VMTNISVPIPTPTKKKNEHNIVFFDFFGQELRPA